MIVEAKNVNECHSPFCSIYYDDSVSKILYDVTWTILRKDIIYMVALCLHGALSVQQKIPKILTWG